MTQGEAWTFVQWTVATLLLGFIAGVVVAYVTGVAA